MRQESLLSKAGYTIPGWSVIDGQPRALLVVHGSGSSKDSSTGLLLAENLPAAATGVFAIDLPAHGDSPVDGEFLRLANCLDDLAAAEARMRQLAPQAEICYFGSSFGAYLLLLYLSLRPAAGRRAVLRSAAVTMPQLLQGDIDAAAARHLQEQGYFLLDEGYGRPLKITQGFLDDLAAHDAFSVYRPGRAELLMIHGAADDIAPLAAAQRFAAYSGAQLLTVPGGQHRLDAPGQPQLVLDKTREFLSR